MHQGYMHITWPWPGSNMNPDYPGLGQQITLRSQRSGHMTPATPAFDANHFADQLQRRRPGKTLSLSHLVPKTQVHFAVYLY